MIEPFLHKGYSGVIDTVDDELGLLSGTVSGMRDVLHFEGQSVAEARASFRSAVDDYLAFCEADGAEPERPNSGRFSVRVAPEVHRRIKLAAAASRLSLNEWVGRRLDEDARREVG